MPRDGKCDFGDDVELYRKYFSKNPINLFNFELSETDVEISNLERNNAVAAGRDGHFKLATVVSKVFYSPVKPAHLVLCLLVRNQVRNGSSSTSPLGSFFRW